MIVLSQILCWVEQLKNIENRSIFREVIDTCIGRLVFWLTLQLDWSKISATILSNAYKRFFIHFSPLFVKCFIKFLRERLLHQWLEPRGRQNLPNYHAACLQWFHHASTEITSYIAEPRACNNRNTHPTLFVAKHRRIQWSILTLSQQNYR